MSLSMFNCSAPLFDGITNHTSVPVWFCQSVCAPLLPLPSGTRPAFQSVPVTDGARRVIPARSGQPSAPIGPLIELLESILDFFLFCLFLFQISPIYIGIEIIILLNIFNRQFTTIIPVWMVEKAIHRTVLVFNRMCCEFMTIDLVFSRHYCDIWACECSEMRS